MCPPRFYDVRYIINPWMEGNIARSSRDLAVQQWERLHAALSHIADVLLVDPDPASPDMVFAANAGLVHQGKVAISRFLHPERQGEEEHFRAWFSQSSQSQSNQSNPSTPVAQSTFTLAELPPDTPFEGEGDALFTPDAKQLWAGYGWRTSAASHAHLAQLWPSVQVLSLRLVDPRFYHLDTCFCPLANGDLLYFPAAFDTPSLAQIESHYTPAQRIAIDEPDAIRFACNAVNAGPHILLNEISPSLRTELESRHYTVTEIPLSEFMKAGGAAKCLVLRLSELAITHAASSAFAPIPARASVIAELQA
jgi:ornithine--oxo-acid transaminase